MRIAFFDWEYALVVPKFEVDTGIYVSALDVDDYEYFVTSHKKPFKDYLVPTIPYEFVEHLRSIHIPCYIISNDSSQYVRTKKAAYIKEVYGKLISDNHIIFVDEEIDKVSAIQKHQKMNQYLGKDCYFLESHLHVIRAAAEAGIDVHPVSEFLLKGGVR